MPAILEHEQTIPGLPVAAKAGAKARARTNPEWVQAQSLQAMERKKRSEKRRESESHGLP